MNNWKAWGNYARINGNHSICKVQTKSGWSYELWQLQPVKVIKQGMASFDEAVKFYEGVAK